MILIAVMVGYVLGVTPFIVINLLERKDKKIEMVQNEKQIKEQSEIFNEWLNGEGTIPNQTTHINLFNEYVTGKETSKEGE